MRKISFKILVFPIFVLIAAFPFFANAENYNFYVDKNYAGQEDGSVEKPFTSVKKAIERAAQERNGLRKIYIREGEYAEDIVIENSVKLFGENKEKTILKVISPTINLIGNNKLKDLTISGGVSALTVQGEAIIENCIIKDANKKGIDLTEGDSLVRIINSTITDNRGKGLYVQKGRSIMFLNNVVANNKGEGFDIRQSISGVIIDNDINNNTESGIEALAAGSDLLIKNNVVKNNIANGIANQSYPDMPEPGKIKIEENIVTQNGKYGIYCGAPSGGTKTKTFFSESIILSGNTNEKNTGKPVSGSCHFERQTPEFVQKIASDIEKTISKEASLQDLFYEIESDTDALIQTNINITNEINHASLPHKMFFGINHEKIEMIKNNNKQINANVEKLSTLTDLRSKTIANSIANLTIDAKEEVLINEKKVKKSDWFNIAFWLPIKITSIFN